MKRRLINISVIAGMNIITALVLYLMIDYLFSAGMSGVYSIVIIALVMIAVLPGLIHLQSVINSVFIPAGQEELFIQAVDYILNIERFDEMLKQTFDRVLDIMSAGSGRLVFYNQEKNDFELYYQKSRKQKLSPALEIEMDNILLQGINGPNDILIKGWLDPLNKRDRELIENLEMLGSEIVIPIYYQKTFMGLVLIGGKKRFNEREIRLLRIFAAKIAINVQNSFYFSNIIKRKEFEKELELTDRMQKQFMPESAIHHGRTRIEVYHKTLSSTTREFYDIFIVDRNAGDIRVSAYRIQGDIKETSILMPGVKALLQCFARFDYSPRRSISVLARLGTEKDVLIGDFIIFHSSLKQDGSFVFSNTGYPSPFVLKRAAGEFYPLDQIVRGKSEGFMKLDEGDMIVIAGNIFHSIIINNLIEYRRLLEENYSLELDDLKVVFINFLSAEIERRREQCESAEKEEEDKLLILIKVEAGP